MKHSSQLLHKSFFTYHGLDELYGDDSEYGLLKKAC